MTHSLGGGTGSGLGTRLFSWIKDSFPLVNLLAVSCAGFAHESPVQNYNAVLALARLQTLCDGIILFNNEHLVNNNTNSTAPSGATHGGASMNDINKDICFSLHGAFLPAASLNPASGVKLKSGAPISFNVEPLELIRSLAPMPSLNVLQLDSVTQGGDATALNLVQSLGRAVKRPWRAAGTDDAEEREKVKFVIVIDVMINTTQCN